MYAVLKFSFRLHFDIYDHHSFFVFLIQKQLWTTMQSHNNRWLPWKHGFSTVAYAVGSCSIWIVTLTALLLYTTSVNMKYNKIWLKYRLSTIISQCNIHHLGLQPCYTHHPPWAQEYFNNWQAESLSGVTILLDKYWLLIMWLFM